MKLSEIIVFVIYLVFMLSIGVFFFFKNKSGGEKTYFLGGRQMGPWVTALSAGASDMSAWVLMGLPTSIYALGVGQVWISVGLAIGYTISWLAEAPRLRRFSIVAGDSITIPQYLTNRFLSKSKALQIICAVIFLVAYTVYAASSVKACGTLFNTVTGMDETAAMYLASLIIIAYTFLGGFSAVCWTDFFQGMLMLGALLIAPIFALFMLKGAGVHPVDTPNYFNAFGNWQDVVSGLSWGLGYFGMPHIIIRFMSLESQKSLKKSAKIGITWTVLIVIFAAAVGIIGRLFLGYDESINGHSLVFITMVRRIFPAALCSAGSVHVYGRLAASDGRQRLRQRCVQACAAQGQGQRQGDDVGRPAGGAGHLGGCAAHCLQSRLGLYHVSGIQRVGRVWRGLRPGHSAQPVLEAFHLLRRRCRHCGWRRGRRPVAGFPFRHRNL